jgi:hypothetical protein
MPDSPRDDSSSAEFHTLLEDMLERVSAAAREAQLARHRPNAGAVDGVSSVTADPEGPGAQVDAASELPASADAQEQDESEASSNVWADTTPFWPDESPEWPEPAPRTPPQDKRPGPDWRWTATAASVDPPASASTSPAAVATIPSTGPAQPPAWMRHASPRALALAAVAAIAGWGAYHAMPGATPAAPVASIESLPPTSAGPVPATVLAPHDVVPGRPALDVAIDADASTESRMLDELTRSVGAPGTASRFAIARYDSLPAASADWQVVATLGTEEVYALVPLRSTLRHLGDLRGRRINVGPDGSARAASGAALYRALFGASPSKSTASALPRDVALRQMLATGEPEAVLLFDGQPSSWLAALPADTRHGLRLLRLEPAEPAARRALQRYLPGRLASGIDGDGDSIPTLREVTFLIAPASARDVAPLLRALCDHLPALRLDGHPKWREVDPGVSLPTGLQRPEQLDATLAHCATAPPLSSINRRSS